MVLVKLFMWYLVLAVISCFKVSLLSQKHFEVTSM